MHADLSFNKELLAVLYKRWEKQPLSPAEQLLLNNWLAVSPDNRETLQTIESGDWALTGLKGWKRENAEAIWNKSRTGIPVAPSRPVFHVRKWFWAAAAALLLLSLGIYRWTAIQKKELAAGNKSAPAMITPGKNGAILTLADGKQVVLDSLGNGVIADQNGSKAALKNGQLTYHPTGNASGGIVYNIMSTPKGRQFNMVLPDGTGVWLNAASSIRYPTVFTGRERNVTITGEAYFEVAANAGMPFRVNVNNLAEIEVLGTHFNINAYDNEKTLNTTLLEGSVKIRAKGRNVLLKPGQQAQVAADIKVIDDADINKTIAWKNGLFNFNDATLEEVMKQLERWYDIDVVYEKGIPDIHFGGGMSKNIPLSDLLMILEKSKVHFHIEGRKLTVLP